MSAYAQVVVMDSDQPPDDTPEVVVAADPAHVEQLVRTAGDLARARDGRIRLVSVVVKSRASPFEVFDDKTIRRQFSGDRRALLERAVRTAPDDVAVESELVVAGSVAEGILEAAAAPATEAVLVGWRGRPKRSAVVLGTAVDTVLRRAPCDVYVERFDRRAGGVDDVLVPVAGGPHVRPAATAAASVAAANDATVTAVSVLEPAADRQLATEWLTAAVETLASAPGPEVAIESGVHEADSVEDALVEMAADHDLVVFGVTRRTGLRKRVVGSVPRRVAARTDRAVLLARAADAAGSPLRSLVERLDPRRGSV